MRKSLIVVSLVLLLLVVPSVSAFSLSDIFFPASISGRDDTRSECREEMMEDKADGRFVTDCIQNSKECFTTGREDYWYYLDDRSGFIDRSTSGGLNTYEAWVCLGRPEFVNKAGRSVQWKGTLEEYKEQYPDDECRSNLDCAGSQYCYFGECKGDVLQPSTYQGDVDCSEVFGPWPSGHKCAEQSSVNTDLDSDDWDCDDGFLWFKGSGECVYVGDTSQDRFRESISTNNVCKEIKSLKSSRPVVWNPLQGIYSWTKYALTDSPSDSICNVPDDERLEMCYDLCHEVSLEKSGLITRGVESLFGNVDSWENKAVCQQECSDAYGNQIGVSAWFGFKSWWSSTFGKYNFLVTALLTLMIVGFILSKIPFVRKFLKF